MTKEDFNNQIQKNSKRIDEFLDSMDRIKDRIEETSQLQIETDRMQKEIDRIQKEHARQIKGLNSHVGGLRNQFGRFTESLVFPSISQILRDSFGVTEVIENARSRDHGCEIDVLGLINGDERLAYIVKVKGQFRPKDAIQALRHLQRSPRAFPHISPIADCMD